MANYVLTRDIFTANGSVVFAGTLVWDGTGSQAAGAVVVPGFVGSLYNASAVDAAANTALGVPGLPTENTGADGYGSSPSGVVPR